MRPLVKFLKKEFKKEILLKIFTLTNIHKTLALEISQIYKDK